MGVTPVLLGILVRVALFLTETLVARAAGISSQLIFFVKSVTLTKL